MRGQGLLGEVARAASERERRTFGGISDIFFLLKLEIGSMEVC